MSKSFFAAGFALVIVGTLVGPAFASAQAVPPQTDPRMYQIVDGSSADRIGADIQTLAEFGTRNTFSDTLSETRGIGAARRWIKAEFDAISAACGGCLEVFYQGKVQEPSGRIVEETNIVNVVAILRGTEHPNRYVIMSGDIDSRASSGSDAETDAPGANDNASGMAGVIEAARLLTQYRFPSSVIFTGLSGEEQGLWGGQHMAQVAIDEGWEIAGVLNNDMIGNIHGIDGVIDNTTFRVFSEATPATEDLQARQRYRTFGGEVDGPSRQLARYVAKMTEMYIPNLDAMMIYRLDRFGRGGHHRPFNDAGFPGVRIMETHEHYDRQHQDLRTEEGREFGDVIEWVDFDHAANLTAVNAISLAGIAWAPPNPTNVLIGGANSCCTTLAWDPVEQSNLAGYKVYWRDTTSPQWQWSRFVPAEMNEFTLENVVIDNFLFGVAAVSADGNESPVVFPSGQLRRR